MAQFVIAYDISDDRRRNRVARVLLGVGERVQKSVFVATLDAEQQIELRRILGVIMREQDQLEWFPLDLRSSAHIAWLAMPCMIESVRVIP